MYLLILQFLVLLAIAWFDFKDRMIPLVLFIIALCCAGFHLYENLWQWPMFAINVGIAVIQLLLIVLWLKIKHRQINIFEQAFGLGDALMLLVVAFYLLPMQYLFFIIVSCAISMVYVLIVRIRKQVETKTQSIPLAGIMATLLMLYQSYLYFIIS
jgi:hypothetical protein